MTPAQQQFLDWLKITDPVAFEVLQQSAGGELGAWEWLGSVWSGVKNVATQVAPALKATAVAAAQAKLQKKYGSRYRPGTPAPKVPAPVQQNIAAQTRVNTQVIREQVQRADRGLPPRRTPEYRPVVPPRVATPAVITQASQKASTAADNMPLYIGGSIALVVLLGAVMLRRRR